MITQGGDTELSIYPSLPPVRVTLLVPDTVPFIALLLYST